MKKLTFLLLLLSFSAFAQIKPKKLKKVIMHVHTYIDDDKTIYCGEQVGLFRIDKRQIVFTSSVVELEIKIVKRGVGQYKSWVGVSRGTYYFITGIHIEDGGIGFMFQPIEKDFNRRYDLPVVILSTTTVCD